MNARRTVFPGLTALLLAACSGGQGDTAVSMAAQSPALPAAIAPAPIRTPPPITTAAPQRVTRTIDKDPDGDGIANRRIIITEIFDASGALIERIREQDFEADGIIDARDVTHFDGALPLEP